MKFLFETLLFFLSFAFQDLRKLFSLKLPMIYNLVNQTFVNRIKTISFYLPHASRI